MKKTSPQRARARASRFVIVPAAAVSAESDSRKPFFDEPLDRSCEYHVIAVADVTAEPG
jgi:hypothetical protein